MKVSVVGEVILICSERDDCEDGSPAAVSVAAVSASVAIVDAECVVDPKKNRCVHLMAHACRPTQLMSVMKTATGDSSLESRGGSWDDELLLCLFPETNKLLYHILFEFENATISQIFLRDVESSR